MGIQVRKTQYVRPGFSLDYPIAGALILLGVAGLYATSHPTLFNQFIGESVSRATVGHVTPQGAGVRLKYAGSGSWLDLAEKTPVSEGDSIATDPSSQASLALGPEGEDRFGISSDSLVVVKIPHLDHEQSTFSLARLRSADESVLEIKKGSIEVRAIRVGKSSTQLQAQGRTLASTPKAGSKLAINGDLTPIALAPSLPKTLAPELLFPNRDAKLTSVDPLSLRLRWKSTSDSEKVLLSENSGEFKMSSASVTLPAGDYAWKITWTENGALRTSEVRRFSVHSPLPEKILAPIAAPQADAQAAQKLQALQKAQASQLQQRQAQVAQQVRVQAQLQETARLAQVEALRAKYASVVAAAQVKQGKTPEATEIKLAPKTLLESHTDTRLGASQDIHHLTVGLQWEPVDGAKNYQIEVQKNGVMLKSAQLTTPHYQLVLDSLDNSSLRYRVSTENASGRKIASDFTAIKVEMSPPAPVVPENGKSFAGSTSITFTWAKTVLTELYQIQFASDAGFSKIVLNTQLRENFLVKSFDGHPGKLYWRVKGIARAVQSDWSAAREIELE